MAEAENPKKFPVFILIVLAILILIIGFVVWRFGAGGFINIFKWFIVAVVFFSIIALIVFGVYWLFKKHRKEMIYILKNSIIRTSKINANPYNQALYLRGGKPFSNRKIGEVVGFAVIKSAVKRMYSADQKSLIDLEKPKDVVFITFNNGGKVSKLLNAPSVFAGIFPDDFANDLTAPEIYVEDGGYGLSPEIFKMFWCAKHWHKRELMDETVKDTIHRLIIEENLNDLHEIIQKAVYVETADKEGESVAEQTGIDKKIGVG